MSTLTTDDLGVLFYQDQKRRGMLKTTVRKRSYDVAQWLTRCADQGIDPLTATWREVQDWIDTKGHLSNKYRYCLLSNVSEFYEAMRRAELCTEDPTVKVPRPKLRPGLPRPIPTDDLERALELTKFSTPMMRCWLALMAYGGLRCAEVAGLERDDVIESQNSLRVLGKGSKERLVPIHPEVAEALRMYGLPRNGPLWRTPGGRKYTPTRVSQMVSAFLQDCEIDASAHQLRHWFGTVVCEKAGIRVTQELMGHASPNSTAIYTKVSTQQTAAAVAAIPPLGKERSH
jgi:integrase/recombinase XerD